jgi:hypothetical protein
MQTVKISGKIGQETVNNKKTGGRVVSYIMPQGEADKIVKAVLEANPSKLKSLMFDYGLNAKAQEVMAYTPPGSVEWKEDMEEVKAYEWTAQDTEKYLATLKAHGEREHKGGFNIETRQATWDEKAAKLRSYGMPESEVVETLGKRPEAKAGKVSVLDKLAMVEAEG